MQSESAGTSRLVDLLLETGYEKLTVLDIAAGALARTRERLGSSGSSVSFVAADILGSEPIGEFDLWHDRALFHFLTAEQDRSLYIESATRAVVPGGYLVLATFAIDGPESCSGLPICRYTAKALAALFASGFSLVRSERIEHETPWGSAQPFTVVVLRRR